MCSLQDRSIVKRFTREDLLDPRWPGRIVMHPHRVDQQPGWCLGATRMDRPQESILDPHYPCVAQGRYGFTPRGGRAVPPDRDRITLAGQAEAQVISGKRQDAAHARFGQEAARIDVERLAP